MCGRFVSAASLEQIAAHFDTSLPGFDAPRSYNVAPTTDIVAVVGNDDARRIETFRWGLVPRWSKDPAKGPPLFNARSETAAAKNSFRGAFRRRRCIVPADGFYEWPRAPKGTPRDERPLPHYITRADGAMLAMAGLWERWSPPPAGDAADRANADAPTGPLQALHSATVLTTAANSFMAPIHDRMPVLLDRSQWETWLDPANDGVDALVAMCAPAAEGILRSHQVGRAVGNVRNSDASLIEPADPLDTSPERLF
ncbi:MAG: SOS response-associated peptidase [Acidimicrobiales bacterium]|nr:SOS response-associated peptidase [Acidimicrobiales bacterium]MYB80612.1 SOS response-associated peptidase [Acidimicrobiales bacterium]MYI11171.1 SOS response-associated peptidase [Acidimicrobiales bacterium]